MSRILITGGDGYIGSWLAEYFSKQGYQIKLLIKSVLPPLQKWLRQFEVVTADISDVSALTNCFNGVDYVFHLAAMNENGTSLYPKEALEVNALGTRNLLVEASKSNIKKFFYFSTFHVYGKSHGIIDENTECWPLSDYGSTHIFAEYYCKQFSNVIDSIIFRVTNAYGSPVSNHIDRWTLMLNNFCKSATTDGVIKINSDGWQKRDLVWLGDIAQALELFLDAKSHENNCHIFNVSSGMSFNTREIASVVQTVFSDIYRKKVDVIFANHQDEISSDPVISLHVSCKKLAQLGYKPSNKLDVETRNIFSLLNNT